MCARFGPNCLPGATGAPLVRFRVPRGTCFSAKPPTSSTRGAPGKPRAHLPGCFAPEASKSPFLGSAAAKWPHSPRAAHPLHPFRLFGKGMRQRAAVVIPGRGVPAKVRGCPWPRLRRGKPKANSGFTTGGVMKSPPSYPDSATHRSKGDDGWLRRGRKATGAPFQIFEDRNQDPRRTAGGSLRGPPRRSRCPRW